MGILLKCGPLQMFWLKEENQKEEERERERGRGRERERGRGKKQEERQKEKKGFARRSLLPLPLSLSDYLCICTWCAKIRLTKNLSTLSSGALAVFWKLFVLQPFLLKLPVYPATSPIA